MRPRAVLAQFVRLLVAAIVALSALAIPPTGSVPVAGASHFRAAQVTWVKGSGNVAAFEITVSFRKSYFFSGAGCPAAGSTFSEGGLSFGDGSSQGASFAVTFCDAANDYVIGQAQLSHAYASAGPFTASYEGCCRLSAPEHRNNPDQTERIETLVNLAGTTASPESSLPPVVDCPRNSTCTFSVPATDPDGQGLRFRFATPAEAGEAGFTQPTGASVNATTGVYTLNTTGLSENPNGPSYYSTQVVVENVVGATVVAKTAVDFFIRLSSATSTNRPPVFNPPTPADGTVFNIVVGQDLTFPVNAGDPDVGNTVTLAVVNKPAAATFTTTPGNPAAGSFSFTPTAPGSFVLNLTATDQAGLGATPRSLTINVSPTVSHVLTVTRQGGGGGRVASSPAGIDCGADCSEAYAGGTRVTLTATPASGSVFAGWGGAGAACSGTAPCVVTMDGAKVVTATFAPAPSTLTVTRQGGGGGRVASSPAGIDCGADCSEAYAGGTRVTLTATPASGSVFAGWGGACAAAGASPTCGLTVAQDEVVTARFDRANAGVAVGRLPGIAPSSDPILLATLTARDGCGPFDRIEFGNLGRSFDNARIGILSPPGWPENQTVGFVYTPPPGTTTVSFGFQRIVQHGGATVSPIRLHDGCGEWVTLVGGGPDAFR